MTERSDGRQFVRFAFYQMRPSWFDLDPGARREALAGFTAALRQAGETCLIRTYSLAGTRADADFLIWQAAGSLEDLRTLQVRLRASPIDGQIRLVYSFLSMTKESQYVGGHRHDGQEGTRARLQPAGARYLFVYPFVKTRDWYRLPLAERQAMMDEHIRIGHRYPSVRLNTTYSFGLDDQEFVVAFETDAPADFLDLVMELRSSQASAYTLRDTPAFTCIAADLDELAAELAAEA